MKIGRNEPCPCGSGKKYKKCCLGKDELSPPKSNLEIPAASRIEDMTGAKLSRIAINNIVEDRVREEETFKRKLKKTNRPLLSDGRKLSNDELISKLSSIGLTVNLDNFVGFVDKFLTAEELSDWVIKTKKPIIKDFDEDWLWICLIILWERFLPDKPCYEIVDRKMHDGYRWMEEDNTIKCCELWLEAWKDILGLMERGNISTIRAFDDKFRGTQSLFNWVNDIERELHNAGLKEERFIHERIKFCSTYTSLFSKYENAHTENMRRAIAESHASLGETEKTDELFRGWLKDDPKWGWGWIGWSDCYGIFSTKQNKNYNKAIEILKEGLSIKGVRDKKYVNERFEDVHSEMKKCDVIYNGE